MSNESFFIYEQAMDTSNHISYINYTKIFITKQNYIKPHEFKKALIYFNSTNYASFQVKKLNFPNLEAYDYNSDIDYYQLCKGENTQKEL